MLRRKVRSVIRRLMGSDDRPKNLAPTDKTDWEFWWQQTQWLDLWLKPETQAACLDYWRRFRHYDQIRSIVSMTNESRILDVGCGLSSVLHFLPGHRTGVDPLGDRYKSIYNYPFSVVASPGERLPFENESFDVVFCSNCIDHVSDIDTVLGQIDRVLRPDGRFILTCEVFAEDFGARNPGHPTSMTAEKLARYVSGWQTIERWESPWYGLRTYALGGPPTDQTEIILILQKLGERREPA